MSHTVLKRWTFCLSYEKELRIKSKIAMSWNSLKKRLFLPKEILYIGNSGLNKFSEYVCFYRSKNITSNTFVACI